MDIKKNNIVISIAILVSTCWGGSESTDGMSTLG